MVTRQGEVCPAPDPDFGPVRTCVGCRTRAYAEKLLRVVIVDGELVPDPRRRLPGRGAWLHPSPDCLRLAEKRRAFPRALRVQYAVGLSAVQDYVNPVSEADSMQ
ncbi:YlxR family protein [Pseudonocardiaceae bacterium YIM PH 21723]|nr:YlxR family protein [Pseudonocardiaceae bacterium YIM PH 21723]